MTTARGDGPSTAATVNHAGLAITGITSEIFHT